MVNRLAALYVLLCLMPISAFGKLTVFTENLSGFQYYNEHGKFVGPNFDKVHRALSAANIDYELNVLGWSLAYNGVLRDPNACIFSLARLPMREPHFKWVAKLSHFTAYFYALPEKQIKLESILAAKEYKTAVIENNFSHHYLTQHGFKLGAQLLVIENVDRLFHIMKQRKHVLDLIVLNEKQYKTQREIDKTTPELTKVFKFKQEATSLYFACNTKISDDMITKLKAGFEAVN
ncbi:amino acid ABC transporter substrate-binding protein [Pseudoalteromonas sp. T1lg24]|uniref:amino acid ABC transporter substrate-binding protein n=1 Tax=Pseudoalteromonas sp. T1lg24 TaxID=2077099 RepID=UPI000CF66E78|nr:amino acid ABC transporter substrate-binding protein [Pseudoalteromonas sp. T1lg24]